MKPANKKRAADLSHIYFGERVEKPFDAVKYCECGRQLKTTLEKLLCKCQECRFDDLTEPETE